ncbi:diguanylate cyclase domain-containing protein [Microbacterium karelineae]|uniref:diguanylate cyclase domain-containing protein n=1 Tax=Microbacterium karelineae TaxID=2654283 RepID=UPI0012EA0D22|nr:diguanylate cyclase [Microbacterium karelineae]
MSEPIAVQQRSREGASAVRVRRGWLSAPRQSAYSIASATGCAYAAALLALHLALHVHDGAEVLAVAGLIALCVVGAASIMCAGARFPRAAGYALAAGAGAGFVATAALTTSLDGLVTTLLLIAPVVVYLGWAYPAPVARATATGIVALVGLAVLANPAIAWIVTRAPLALVVGAAMCAFALEVSIAQARELDCARRTDPLTGALNRRGISGALATARAEGGTAIVIDLDGLKPVNDHDGHAAGDRLLRASVDAWRRVLGPRSRIGRLGGDEFAILVTGADAAHIDETIGRLRSGSPHSFSASIVPLSRVADPDDLFALADAGLYRDKRRRRARPAADIEGRVAPPRHRGDAGIWIGAAALFALRGATGVVSAVAPVVVVAAAVELALAVAFGTHLLTSGGRSPTWVRALWTVCIAATTAACIAYAGSAGAEISALAGVTPAAILVACLARSRAARVAQALFTAAIVAGVAVAGPHALVEAGRLSGLVAAATAWYLMEILLITRARLRHVAQTDPLTGARDRAGLDEALERAVLRARRRRASLSVAVVDFDRFKQINDRRGHAAGDAALRAAVAAWRDALRRDDVIGRSGGDEFAILLPNTSEDGARTTIARLRGEARDPWSWGVATLRDGDDMASLLARADDDMRAAKR